MHMSVEKQVADGRDVDMLGGGGQGDLSKSKSKQSKEGQRALVANLGKKKLGEAPKDNALAVLRKQDKKQRAARNKNTFSRHGGFNTDYQARLALGDKTAKREME